MVDRGLSKTNITGPARPDTAQDLRAPYAHGIHNLAASSMLNLRSIDHSRQGSYSSLRLKPNASDANLRTRFAANNGSSASLAAPAAAFGARFRAHNGSSSSLTAPGPGFSSRLAAKNGSSVTLALPGPSPVPVPGNSNGKPSPLGSPLDGYMRSPASAPSTPRSPLGEMQLPPTPKDETDNSSVFGEEADDMVDTIMASVEEKLAKEKEVEVGRRREMARLEVKAQEKQTMNDTLLADKAALQPRVSAGPGPVFKGNVDQRPSSRNGLGSPTGPNILSHPGPVLSGNVDERPTSRGEVRGKGSSGPLNSATPGIPIHQGPPRHSPPTQDLPRPPNQTAHRRGPYGAAHDGPRGSAQGGGPDLARPESRAKTGDDNHVRRLSPDVVSSCGQSPVLQRPQGAGIGGYGPRINTSVQESRAQSPVISPLSHGPAHTHLRSFSPARSVAVPRVLGGNGVRAQSPAPSSLGPNGYKRQDSGSSSLRSPTAHEPSLRDLMSQSPEPVSATRSESQLSGEGDLIEQYARPIIRSVQARRDTLTLASPRRHSLSMEIEELEKSLVQAQQTQIEDASGLEQDTSSRASMTSSFYSDDVDDDDQPIVTLQPAPSSRASPLLATDIDSITWPQRELNPTRASFILRRGPRRPTLDEYGVTSQPVANNNLNCTYSPMNGGSGGTSPSHSLRFHQPNRTLSPTPTLDPLVPPPTRRQRPIVSTVIDAGFKFDFGPSVAPPTPDSATWPLASPSSPAPLEGGMETPEPYEVEPEPLRLDRSKQAPPPLNFNFSPDAYSRDPGIWTPPLRSSSHRPPNIDGRPSTSQEAAHGQGLHLAAAPQMPPVLSGPPSRSRTPVDGAGAEEAAAAAAALGIGMARGLSVKGDPRQKRGYGMVDSFGTGFI